MLTTWPNALAARVHERMPVVIAASELDRWLGGAPAEAARALAPAPEDALVATRVSKHVNSVRNDDPGCVRPAGPA